MKTKATSAKSALKVTTYEIPTPDGTNVFSFGPGTLRVNLAEAKKHGLTIEQWLALRHAKRAVPDGSYRTRAAKLEITFRDPDVRRAVEALAALDNQSVAEFVHAAVCKKLGAERQSLVRNPVTGAFIRLDWRNCHHVTRIDRKDEKSAA